MRILWKLVFLNLPSYFEQERDAISGWNSSRLFRIFLLIVFITDSTPLTRFYDPSCARCKQPSRPARTAVTIHGGRITPPGTENAGVDGIGPADAFIQVPHSNSFVRSRTYTRTCVTEGVVATTLRHRLPVSNPPRFELKSSRSSITPFDRSSSFPSSISFHFTIFLVESFPSKRK